VIRAVIFDLDGTLVDSVADLHSAANRLLREQSLPALDRPTLQSFIGNGIPVLVERCLRQVGAATDDLASSVKRFKEIYEDQGHRETTLFPAVAEALDQLADRGYRLALCTNKDWAPARRILAQLGVAGYFDRVVGGDTLPVNKPDPRPLLAAAEGCDAAQGEFVYVGDSEVDAELAHRAAVPFLLFTEGYRRSPVEAMDATLEFSDYSQLPDLVDGLRRRASS
jgi:phosphoglycolate phosphatase